MKKVIVKISLIILIILGLVYFLFDFNEEREIKNRYVEDPTKIYVFPPFDEVHKNDVLEFDIKNIANFKDKAKFDKNLRERVYNLANFLTEPDKKPKIGILSEEDKGKYIQQKISIKIYPSTKTYAYMLIPKNINYPAPLILAMHGHGNHYDYAKEEVVGNAGDSSLFYAKELAERGYLVLAPDAPLFGDRILLMSGENSGETLEEFGAQSLMILGHSLLGELMREDISILNAVSSLKNIDNTKIGCIGHSFGGLRCMYLSALDERIKVTVLSNSVNNLRRKYNNAAVHTWFGFIPGLGRYTETDGILGLISPRPLMIVYSEKDPVFLKEETEENIKKVENLYNLLGEKEKFVFLFIPNEGHSFPQRYHEQTYAFLDKFLKT